MSTDYEAWPKLTVEDAMDPGLPICDAHHHLWVRPNERYLLEELLQDTTGGHHVVQTVFVECRSMYKKDGPKEMQPVGETEFVNGIALQSASGQYAMTNVAAGIVGFVDLALGAAVAPILESHIAVSPERFRGIRNVSAFDASPEVISRKTPPKGLLFDSKFREGFAYLQKYSLSFDAWLFHTQLMELVDLARAFPDTTIILNHVGGPIGIGPYAKKREEVFQEWKHGITMLATCNNVVVKLGGFGIPLFGFGWHERATPPSSAELAEAITPYCSWCIEQFGVDRCMFESNFPVDKRSYSYTVLWNAFKRFSEDFSQADRAALFHGTAQKTYRLVIDDEE